jgi:hypothetical protein
MSCSPNNRRGRREVNTPMLECGNSLIQGQNERQPRKRFLEARAEVVLEGMLWRRLKRE